MSEIIPEDTAIAARKAAIAEWERAQIAYRNQREALSPEQQQMQAEANNPGLFIDTSK